jgi:thioredoxin 1
MAKHVQVLNDENFDDVIESGVTLVDFSAEWCGPCRMLTPVLEKVSEEMHKQVSFGKLDIDQSVKTAGLFQVTSVPTLILFKNGKEVGRLVGLRDASTIKDFAKSAL